MMLARDIAVQKVCAAGRDIDDERGYQQVKVNQYRGSRHQREPEHVMILGNVNGILRKRSLLKQIIE
jgi:hypothetical protein